ncbi:MAG: hypothetical protein ACYC8T_13890 [Myxococcaceae bacterium]
MFRSILPVLAVAASLAGCGPGPGSKCSGEGFGLCDSKTAALICEGGEYRQIPCRGGAGCVAAGARFVCDIQAVNGDPCPFTSEGNAQCDVADPDSGYKCTAGTWVTQHCRSCSAAAGQVTCLTP